MQTFVASANPWNFGKLPSKSKFVWEVGELTVNGGAIINIYLNGEAFWRHVTAGV